MQLGNCSERLTPLRSLHPSRILALGTAAILAGSACHRNTVRTTAIPMVQWPSEQHCWWAAFRTTMPPDSIAMRFSYALESIGLSGGSSGSLADTAWAQAGPTTLVGDRVGRYAARVVAIRFGDSTRLRPFVAADTSVGGRLIGMCGDLMSRAAVRAFAPRQQEADDSSPRWRRRP